MNINKKKTKINLKLKTLNIKYVKKEHDIEILNEIFLD